VNTDTGFASNLLMRVQEEQVAMRRYSLSATKWKLAPGFTVGYFNQVEPTVPWKYNLQFGIRVPLFFNSYTSAIKFDRISLKRAEAEMELTRLATTNELSQALARLRSQRANLSYFNTIALPQSAEMIRTSNRTLESGEVNYALHLMSIDKAFAIRKAWLEALYNYTLTCSQIKYLKGEYK
jgi:hypothetical protein